MVICSICFTKLVTNGSVCKYSLRPDPIPFGPTDVSLCYGLRVRQKPERITDIKKRYVFSGTLFSVLEPTKYLYQNSRIAVY
jgi:hypothetical protein